MNNPVHTLCVYSTHNLRVSELQTHIMKLRAELSRIKDERVVKVVCSIGYLLWRGIQVILDELREREPSSIKGEPVCVCLYARACVCKSVMGFTPLHSYVNTEDANWK